MLTRTINKVIIGIGSPVLSDGAVPLAMINYLRTHCGNRCRCTTLPAGGFDLLAELEGFERAIIIAVFPQQDQNGSEIIELVVSAATDQNDTCSALPGDHGIEVASVLALGRQCGYSVPDTVVLMGITGANVCEIGEQKTAAVAENAQKVLQRVEKLIAQWDT